MTKQNFDFTKILSSQVVTLLMAGLGAYIGVKVSLTELRKDVEQIKPIVLAMDPKVTILGYMHGMGIRDNQPNKPHAHIDSTRCKDMEKVKEWWEL